MASTADLEAAFERHAKEGTVDLRGACQIARELEMDVLVQQVRMAFKEADTAQSARLNKAQVAAMISSLCKFGSRVVGGVEY